VSMDHNEIERTRIPPPARIEEATEASEFARFLRHASQIGGDPPHSLRAWIDLAEAWRIAQALRDCGGNRSAAARSLGIGRRTLYAKMEKLGITPTWEI